MGPLLFTKSHHDCRYNECFKIFYEGRLGICVEKAIDNACMAIAVLMYFIIYGSALVLSKNKNAFSPFVVMAMVFALVVFIAFIDPSKWKFVIAISIPMVILIGATIYDNKINNNI